MPTDPENLKKHIEIEKLNKELAELEKATAEAKQAQAEAEKNTLLAKLPKSEKQGLEGTITTDEKFGYVAEIAAYEAMSRVVDELSTSITGAVGADSEARVLIVNDLRFAVGDVVGLQLRNTMDVMRNLLTRQKYKNAEQTKLSSEHAGKGQARVQALPVAEASVIAQSLVTAAAELVSYFQSNFDVKGQDIELAREAVAHQLAGKLQAHHPMLFEFHLLEKSGTLELFSYLLELKQELGQSQLELQIRGIQPLTSRVAADTADLQRYKGELEQEQTEIARLADEIEAKPADQEASATTQLEEARTKLQQKQTDVKILGEEIRELEGRISEATGVLDAAKAADSETTALAAAFDKFVESVTTPASPAELPALAQAALRNFVIEKGITHLLWIKPISSGGEAIAQKQLFRSGHVSYVGGCVISYVLAKTDGTIVSAGTKQGLSQISHVLSTNRQYRLKRVKLEPANPNWIEKFFDERNL